MIRLKVIDDKHAEFQGESLEETLVLLEIADTFPCGKACWIRKSANEECIVTFNLEWIRKHKTDDGKLRYDL